VFTRLRARVVAAWSVPFSLVVALVGWNAWSMWPELLRVSSLNDGTFQLAYLRWATERLRAGRTPFDGLFGQLGLGFPIFHHYQVVPHLLAAPVALLFGAENTWRWSQFLLLATWPLCVWWGARQFGFGRWAAAIAAMASPFLVSLNGYGFERGSYLWRGYGMWTQVFGMWCMPLALGAAWRALRDRRSLLLPSVLLAVTLCSHVLTGYLTLVVVMVFGVVVPLAATRGDGGVGPWAKARLAVLARAAAMAVMTAALSAWMLLPAFRDRVWVRNSLPDHTFWTDSYGARRVLWWLVDGGIFDHGRKPVVTILVLVGLVCAVARCRRDGAARASLGVFGASLVLFFGRPTLRGLVDLLPVHTELFLHRMVVGVHLGGLFLAGYGVEQVVQWLLAAYRRWRAAWIGHPLADEGVDGEAEPTAAQRELEAWEPFFLGAGAAVAALVLVLGMWPLARQARSTDGEEHTWITEQRQSDRTEGRDLATLLARTDGNRVYAGPQGDGRFHFTLSSVPGPLALLDHGALGVGFGGRVPAITEPTESSFDGGNEAAYELFDVRWLVLPVTAEPPTFAVPVATSGALRLYRVGTSGWLRVVDTDQVITTTVDAVAKDSAAFVAGDGALRHLYPLLAMNGRAPGTPTVVSPISTDAGSPGTVASVDARIDDGVVSGVVDLRRRGAVVVPISFHPRWHARVDGKAVPTQIVAPGLLAVTVGPGHHTVELRYNPVPISTTAAWFVLGVVLCAAVLATDRRVAQRNWVADKIDNRIDSSEATSHQ
jgi:hypothetical protein